jgi:hypothetical protein
MAEKRCIPLTGVSDGPYMLEPPGTLTALQNMRLRPGGYAEARGGMEKLQPAAGTPSVPIDSSGAALTSGGTPAGIQISSSFGWIVTYNAAATSFSDNKQFAPGDWLAFNGLALNNALYFGADAPFGRIGIKLQIAANWIATFTYEYWDGATWSAFTTQETITWTTVTTNPIDSYASWQFPSNWAASSVTGLWPSSKPFKYWMRIRCSAFTSVTTEARVGFAFGSWIGTRDLYLMSQKPFASGPNGTLQRYGQTGSVAEYGIAGSNALYSAPDSIPSMATYRGRIFFTEPKETMRWDGNVLQNVGNLAPGTAGSSRVAGAGLGAGIWRHYIAWGYGPLQSDTGTATNYMTPFYGISRATLVVPTANADPNDSNSIQTTAGNERARIDWTAISIPADAGSIVIYRTQDLTGINVAQRAGVPAYPVYNLNRHSMIAFTTFDDGSIGTGFIDGAPQAVLYDNLPPKYSRFCFIFENRLVLGGGPGSGWYYSDPFFPDQFNNTFQFLQFVRAQGGRDMGGVEFAGWGVFFTEDQTWGAQNLDADEPYLIPIHSGVGCVAPWAVTVGDGWLIWPARDGIYAWDGSKAGPKNVSGKFKHTFASLNFEAHGGSRAVIHNHKYDLTFVDAKNGQIGAAFTLNLENFEWSTRTTNDKKIPLCLIHAPLGHADAGVPHALYAKATIGTSSASDATSYSPCVADYTTQDDGTNYTCLATAHFPLPPGGTFSPKRVLAYYDALDGWVTPTLAVAASNLGDGDVGSITTGGPDTGTDYSIIAGTYSLQSSGTSDLKVTLSASSAAGGAVYGQRFFGMVLEGEEGEFRQGGL